MFNLQQWMDETVSVSTWNGTVQQRRADYLYFLIYANGSAIVRGWGCISNRNGHQSGLEQNQALALLEYSAFLSGLECAGVNTAAFWHGMNEYAKRFDGELVIEPPSDDRIEQAAQDLEARLMTDIAKEVAGPSDFEKDFLKP
ncbi:hypothetical protein [Achromobacter phage Motura]|uniref:Uncharacterized protein n=1 Tax=Achromobacter phage Motura TaxID=2591403 RepID=A0A514CT54_9CAUD|nr:hypothetical protein H1O15_gp097 [Achromobacter phage Motura]QDH83653.1 hypothetical protein [Achromobacter phage Motura]